MSKINILEVIFTSNNEINILYPVIIEDENEMILIDCGYPNFLELIEDTAVRDGINIKKLSKIIITHHDFAHMGSLTAFKRKYPNIKILASKEEAPYINGDKKSLRLQQAKFIYNTLPEEEKEGARNFEAMLESIESCTVDMELKDKDCFDFCGGIEIVSTPGHMPGHISIYHKESKSLIAGDAVVLENGKLDIALPQYTLDINEAKKSIKKLLEYDIDQIICYHGGIYENNIIESLKEI
ncbi:MBL fold metallo-hydrolase [Clostridium sp. C8]|uniref:MBL fold metallo-hydrolase n=1 Tax=Clostridium sp. C8 TaxID=1667357 RepID=UPI00062E6B64|nr:MBL fold metallo-hydrolase [Clostridium sp. C8]KLE15340.1 metal-dependent hydrolase [Clostridium sp. C8]